MEELFLEDVLSPEMDSTQRKKNKKRQNLEPEQIKKLAAEVKRRPAIWDLTNTKHYNNNAIKQAWNEIAKVMNVSENECKTSWTALRESHRYRLRTKKQKSESSKGTPIDAHYLDDSMDDWEYSEDLAFLPYVKRKTNLNVSRPMDTFTLDEIENNSIIDLDVSNNSYQSEPSSTTTQDKNVAGLVSNLTEMVKVLRTESNKNNIYTLKYELIVRNIDRMLQQLPSSQIEDVNFEIVSLIYKKIKENREKNITQ